LRRARIAGDHGIEMIRKPDRGLTIAGRHVDRKPPARRLGSEPGTECRRIAGAIPFVSFRCAGKMVTERRRRRHAAIVWRKKTPGFEARG
jgi:hypothetical protein